MKHGIFLLLILVLAAFFARSSIISNAGGMGNQFIDLSKSEHIFNTDRSIETFDSSRNGIFRLETDSTKTSENQNKPDRSINGYLVEFEKLLSSAVDRVQLIKQREFYLPEDDYEIKHYETTSTRLYSVNAVKKDIFIVRDKNNESIIFLGTIEDY